MTQGTAGGPQQNWQPNPDEDDESRGGRNGDTSSRRSGRLKSFAEVVTLIAAVAGAAGAIWAAVEAYKSNDDEKPTASIDSPKVAAGKCADIGSGGEVLLEGTSNIKAEDELWEITQPPDNSLWVGANVSSTATEKWKMTIHKVGAVKDIGEYFKILIVAAPPNSAKKLREASLNGSELDSIPPGVSTLATLCVRRTA